MTALLLIALTGRVLFSASSAVGSRVCAPPSSVPNPLTGHPYLYPGLFEYANFRCFLEQSGFVIERVAPWQKVPRGMILPRSLRKIPLLRGRIIAGGFEEL